MTAVIAGCGSSVVGYRHASLGALEPGLGAGEKGVHKAGSSKLALSLSLSLALALVRSLE